MNRWAASGSAALLLALALVLFSRTRARLADASKSAVRLRSVGPRWVSNQTAYPLALQGEGFKAGQALELGAPFHQRLPLEVADERHAYARLPANLRFAPDAVQGSVTLSVVGPDPRERSEPLLLNVVNDAAFADFTEVALSSGGQTLFTASSPTDTLVSLEVASGKTQAHATADGPSALATFRDPKGQGWLVVGHRYAPVLHLWALSAAGSLAEKPKVLPAPEGVAGLLVAPEGDRIFLASQVTDSVYAVSPEDGRLLWSRSVDPNPRALALLKGVLAVGNLQTGELQLLSAADGSELQNLAPGPGTPIVGRTARFSDHVMGGKAARFLLSSPKLSRFFIANLGPNVGPNAERMEVSANSGVMVLAPAMDVREPGLPPFEILRHQGFDSGATEGLALDEGHGILYAADEGLGLVRILDAQRLASREREGSPLLQTVRLPPLEDSALVRPAQDFGVDGRAGVELHSGPRALVLSPDAQKLYVLNRFSQSVAVVDVSAVPRQQPAQVLKQWPLADPAMRAQQQKRRQGQVLYFADMGRTGMSCDACHLEGHTGGVFFEKTRPMRIYRSTTVRGARDTPPYFTPASTHSLAETSRTVGNRNRFHQPDLTEPEVEALTLFTSLLVTPPNPFVGKGGAPPVELSLPGGGAGRPAAGRALFEGKGACQGCHPAPLFTTDQDPETRGRYQEVGTPAKLPLRPELQDRTPPGFAPPSLVGVWDIWPLLSSGAGGYAVEGERLGVRSRFPLRPLLEQGQAPHAPGFSAQEVNDLLAFLMTL